MKNLLNISKLFTLLMLFAYSGNIMAEKETYTFGDFKFEDKQTSITFNAANFSITLDANGNSTLPSWYANPGEVRLYSNEKLIISSSHTITQITYNYNINNGSNNSIPTVASVAGSTNAGTWTERTQTWEGADNEVTLTRAANAGNLGFISVTVTFTEGEVTLHTATFYSNGEVLGAPQRLTRNATIQFPSEEPTLDGKVFKGWIEYEITTPQAEAPETTSLQKMGDSDVNFYAVFATENIVEGQTVTDVLDRDFTGITSTTYDNWENKTGSSGAIYAGNTAGSYASIQLRASNDYKDSGIITTSSGGKAAKVTIVWNSNTDNGRIIDIYGKENAYTSPSELYGSKPGTKIGSITNGTTTTLTISPNYSYIGIRSHDKTIYLTSISIEWTGSTTTQYTDYSTGSPVNRKQYDLIATDGNRYWATFSNTKHTFIEAEGVYTITADGEELLLNELNKTELSGNNGYWIPANTPVLLMNTSEQIMMHNSTIAEVPSLSLGNDLVATTTTDYYAANTDPDGYYYYKLAYNNYTEKTGLGFYWGADNGTGYFKVKEGAAILRLPRTDGAPQGYAFSLDPSTLIPQTKAIETTLHPDIIYNIAGQRVNNMQQRGIYIIGNKKRIK